MAATASRKMRLLNVLGAGVFLFVLMCHLGQNLTGERELRSRGIGHRIFNASCVFIKLSISGR